ncbi:extracellular calcium-sensing receptor-like [Pleurodeles waltl]|uniref:extracellular calcium-sensing receptor-like n=1 Tax=Pleurodeles waltl TaxID=8319 RepID=UPI00370974F9
MNFKNCFKMPSYQNMVLCLIVSYLRPHCDSQRTRPECHLQGYELSGLARDGDVLIGGMFNVHTDILYQEIPFTSRPAPLTCTRFGLLNYQWLQAMVFAIEEINANPDILPNITLGFRIYDSCLMRQRALEGTFWMLTGPGRPVPNYRCLENQAVAAIVGDAGSSCSIDMARILGPYQLPQISYFSSSPLLSDRNQFPSFFRTVPSDDYQSRGLAQMLIHFGWSWVGLLAEDNDYGQHGVQILHEELTKAGACVAFSESIITSRAYNNAYHVVQTIKHSTAIAIVFFCNDPAMTVILDEIVRQNVTGKIWIASESWSTSLLISTEKYSEILKGTIGFAIHRREMPGFKEHLNNLNPTRSPDDTILRTFWEKAFECKWLSVESVQGSLENETPQCTGKENLDSRKTSYYDPNNLGGAYSAYNAAYAIALALQDLMYCSIGLGPFYLGSCADIMDFQPWQLHHYVKKVHFQNNVGEQIFFDKSGNIPAQYDIVNWQCCLMGSLKYVKVGSYDSSDPHEKHLFINSSAIQWTTGVPKVPVSVCSPSCPTGFRKVAREGQPVCCFQCVRCPQGEISNLTDSVECFKCPWDSWPNVGQNHCARKKVEFLTYEEPLGASLTILCIFFSCSSVTILGLFLHSRNTPIVKANNRSLSYLLLLSLTLCFLSSLAFIGYPTPEKCLIRQVAFGITFALSVSCILAKTIMVVIVFSATKPNSDLRKWMGPQLSYILISACTFVQALLCIVWLFIHPPFSDYNLRTEPAKIIVECNEGSPIAFWGILGYLGLLATICFLVAFLARKLPDCFNEAQFITFSMLAFLSVWLSFIPAYLSTHGKYMVAMEVFAILSSTFALVSCIFFPKCYIILLTPENNSKAFLMGRNQNID